MADASSAGAHDARPATPTHDHLNPWLSEVPFVPDVEAEASFAGCFVIALVASIMWTAFFAWWLA